MWLKRFFLFVEIQTKVASIIPFILGTTYSLYRYESFQFKNFIVMFIALISFDMATTAINNYCDYKKAVRTMNKPDSDLNNTNSNVIERYGMEESTALGIIFILLSIATAFGILLTLNTNITVLLIGMICFISGILYTFGPVPISRMPLGEIFSGIFMGFVIPFLAIYIHVFDQNIITLTYEKSMLNLSINIIEMFYMFLISLPLISGIANIMLANNICDIEEDVVNRRYTLPYYIGKKNALVLFSVLYYLGYLTIVVSVLLKILPIVTLLVLLTVILVNKNINLFTERPVKSETFVLAVKNFVIINLSYILLMSIAIIIN